MTPQIVSFNCTLKNTMGSILSKTFNRDIMTSLDAPQTEVLSGLIKGIQNLKVGENRKIAVPADKAYGFYDPKKVVIFPRKKIGKDRKFSYGDIIFIVGKSESKKMYRVIEIYGDLVVLDGNHPLAGQDLVFEIEALDVRDATTDEISSSSLISEQVFH